MTLNTVNISCSINFKENEETISDNLKETVKSDYERIPQDDSFVKSEEEVTKKAEINSGQESENDKQTDEAKPKKKKHIGRKILLWTIATPALIYGCIVLKHRLSKPTFKEIQKIIKEIFDKDLSNEELKSLLDKYKKLLKNDNTEDFAKQLIEQLKNDYDIEKVRTNVSVELLKDGKIKTALNHTTLGCASPFGDINIMPRTNSNVIVRETQKEIFSTGFHELKHLKQFADAYRADSGKFVDVLYESMDKDEIFKELYKETNVYDVGLFAREIKKVIKSELYAKFGKLEPYKVGTEEYKKGMEYIDAYLKYPDPSKDYKAYRENLLEKEAWKNGDLSKKIYSYLKSIWTL